MSQSSKEVWKDIPGHENKYQASDQGNIRSLTRQITQIGRWGKPFTRTIKGRVLRPGRYASSGHISVVLGHGANGSPVHQLVALTFIGPRPEKADTRHLNGIPTDNRVENLCYGSRTENILDHFRQGKAWRKLDYNQMMEIKEKLKAGKTGHALAVEYKVSDVAISNIKVGRYKSCGI